MAVSIVHSFEEAGLRVTLRDLGTHFELLLGQVPILSSRALATERELGKLLRTLVPEPGPRILIGGLGFGATVAGVLSWADERSVISVVEKLETVIALMRGKLAHLSPGTLDDPRVRVVHGDVGAAIARERHLNAILLDVDNGPHWASFRSNASLYAPAGLAAIRDALRPDGVVMLWSGYPADRFVGRLRGAGLLPSVVPLQENGLVRARAYIGRRAAP